MRARGRSHREQMGTISTGRGNEGQRPNSSNTPDCEPAPTGRSHAATQPRIGRQARMIHSPARQRWSRARSSHSSPGGAAPSPRASPPLLVRRTQARTCKLAPWVQAPAQLLHLRRHRRPHAKLADAAWRRRRKNRLPRRPCRQRRLKLRRLHASARRQRQHQTPSRPCERSGEPCLQRPAPPLAQQASGPP